LAAIGAIRAEDVADDLGRNAHGSANQDEQKNGEVLIEVHLADLITTLSLPTVQAEKAV
jgi:hypothetical protein